MTIGLLATPPRLDGKADEWPTNPPVSALMMLNVSTARSFPVTEVLFDDASGASSPTGPKVHGVRDRQGRRALEAVHRPP